MLSDIIKRRNRGVRSMSGSAAAAAAACVAAAGGGGGCDVCLFAVRLSASVRPVQ